MLTGLMTAGVGKGSQGNMFSDCLGRWRLEDGKEAHADGLYWRSRLSLWN